MENFGSTFKELRGQKNKKQKDMAEILNIS